MDDTSVSTSGAAGEAGGVPLFESVYAELRRIAAVRLSHEKPGLTLQPTALVHEAWMKLAAQIEASAWDSKAHFFSAAAEAMRRILIDTARRKAADKRQPPASDSKRPMTVPVPELSMDELMDLDGAVNRLQTIDSGIAELVRLRLFAGLSIEEAANVIPIPVRTAYRNWRFAEAWLYRELGLPEPSDGGGSEID